MACLVVTDPRRLPDHQLCRENAGDHSAFDRTSERFVPGPPGGGLGEAHHATRPQRDPELRLLSQLSCEQRYP